MSPMLAAHEVVVSAIIGAAAAVFVELLRQRHDHKERRSGRRRTRHTDARENTKNRR